MSKCYDVEPEAEEIKRLNHENAALQQEVQELRDALADIFGSAHVALMGGAWDRAERFFPTGDTEILLEGLDKEESD